MQLIRFLRPTPEGYPPPPYHLPGSKSPLWFRTACGNEIRTSGERKNAIALWRNRRPPKRLMCKRCLKSKRPKR